METAERIIVCNEHPYNGKWFYVKNGVKRWITSIEAAKDNQIDTSKIQRVSVDEANKYITGMQIIKNIGSLGEITNPTEARAYFLKDLEGYGIEFGAATSPSIMPDSCVVEYADFFQVDEGCNKEMEGDFVPITFFTSLDEMKGINSSSLDFIINCHVIEHVAHTLLALELCFDRLKPGGKLFMTIPHMDYSFDSLRPLTTIEHFAIDYNNYVKERDMLHLVDYVEHTNDYCCRLKGADRSVINLYPLLDSFMQGIKHDIHYHTFTEKNTAELLEYFNTNIHEWSKTEIIPRIPFEGSNEFYVKLTK